MQKNVISSVPYADIENLKNDIINKKATIGIVGLGYVGLPLARAVNRQGYRVLGFDTDIKKIQALESGRSYIKSLSNHHVQEMNDSQKFLFTNGISCLGIQHLL